MSSKKWKIILLLITTGILIYLGINIYIVQQEQVITAASEAQVRERYESTLPVVYIDTESSEPIDDRETYVKAAMEIQGNELFPASEKVLYTGTVEIKGRGNLTWEQLPKKSYKLKLGKSADIFGFGKNKHWVLIANYAESSLMRNTVIYELSGKLGMPHMETTWVDFVLNGEYMGTYQFCEQIRIDKNRVDIFDWKSFAEDTADAIAKAESIMNVKALEKAMVENLEWVTSKQVTFEEFTYNVEDYVEIPDDNGGYLLELDQYYDEISVFKTQNEQPIMFQSPEFAVTNPEMMNYVQEYIQAFEDAVQSDDYTTVYQGTKTHYSELFDFDSLVDYWLLNEIFFNEEFNKKSTYLYKDIDGLFKMGPMWDMDYSSGGEGNSVSTDQWAVTSFSLDAQAEMWYKYLINDPYFLKKARERYWEIRGSYVEDIIKDGGVIDTYQSYLQESGEKNAELWPYKYGFNDGVRNFKEWMQEHLNWLDQQMQTEETLSNSLK